MERDELIGSKAEPSKLLQGLRGCLRRLTRFLSNHSGRTEGLLWYSTKLYRSAHGGNDLYTASTVHVSTLRISHVFVGRGMGVVNKLIV